ncbi:MAG: hypothetical protein AB7O37_11365 [Vicinamibacteria bacterium]
MTTHEHALEDREAQAAREVGQTRVSPAAARALVALFVALALVPVGMEIARDLRSGAGAPWGELRGAPAAAWREARASGLLAGNARLLGALSAFESALEDRSLLARRALPDVQAFLTRRLGAGNEQVVVGRKGWLYFRPAIDSLTGPGFLKPEALARQAAAARTGKPSRKPDPIPALARFAAQLAERGIGLVVVPVPVKASLHPEGLAPALVDAVPIENPSHRRFLERLEELGIPAFDPAEGLARARREQPWPHFLRTDTHWTPQAMEAAAQGLAGFLARRVPLVETDPARTTRRPVWVEGRGDLAALLRLPLRRPLFQPERVLTQQVLRADGEPWRPDANADVLVLGDSFTNVYSQRELGFGDGAGFAAQLSHFLARPVDALAVNAGGPSAARERLAERIAAGEDRLAGKRLVVYEFAARELSGGDWRPVDLGPGSGAAPPRSPEAPLPARGTLVWESNRSGDWRIWTRRLEGSAARRLSPDEPDRQHCCAHLSPDGQRLVYLSRAEGKDEYPEPALAGELRLLRLDGSEQRTLLRRVRLYGWGNRSVVWRSDRELVYVGADGRTRLLDLATGQASALTDEPRGRQAWLLDATLRHAVTGNPVFSAYDAASRRVIEGPRRSGCEPYFSHDGRWGFWVEEGGGPIRRLDLRSGEVGIIVDKDDARLPASRRYVYFPMLSRDGRMLAYGASAGDHDHYRSNYDVFVAPVDPARLDLAGRPLRMTSHPGSDRYPDVHVEELDLARWRQQAPSAPAAPPGARPVATEPFDARLVLRACSRVPSLREISPYRDALVVCEWDVAEVLRGASSAARVRVAHWGMRDGQRLPIAGAAPGLTRSLRLEPLAGTLQLEGYTLSNTLPPAPGIPLLHTRER